MKVVTATFEIQVLCEDENPNGMIKGPGPFISGFLENIISDLHGLGPSEWTDVSDLRLVKVAERPALKQEVNTQEIK